MHFKSFALQQVGFKHQSPPLVAKGDFRGHFQISNQLETNLPEGNFSLRLNPAMENIPTLKNGVSQIHLQRMWHFYLKQKDIWKMEYRSSCSFSAQGCLSCLGGGELFSDAHVLGSISDDMPVIETASYGLGWVPFIRRLVMTKNKRLCRKSDKTGHTDSFWKRLSLWLCVLSCWDHQRGTLPK